MSFYSQDMYRGRIILLLLLLLLASTCSNKLNDLVIVSELEEEFLVAPWENLDGPERTFEILLQSIEELDCSNTTLDISSGRTGNQLFITINELIKPDDCRQDRGIISSRVNFGRLGPGQYTLRINLLGIAENELFLTISPDRFKLVESNLNGLQIGKKDLLRVPENTFWGLIGLPENLLDIGPDFITALEAETLPLELPVGDYGYFELADSPINISLIDPVPSALEPFSFLREYPEDTKAIDSIFQSYEDLYKEDILLIGRSGTGFNW